MSSTSSPALQALLKELFLIGSIKFGSFKLKSGITSPIYIDLRVTISYPKGKFELICGVPYTALPFATCMSLEHDVPLLIRRKEGPKEYGTKQSLEGVYRKGQRCLVIEDLVTSGGSVLQVVESLRAEGLVVEDVVVFLDRQQGAQQEISKKNLRLHSLVNITTMLGIFQDLQLLDSQTIENVKLFIQNHQMTTEEPKRFPFPQRASHVSHEVSKKLLRIIQEKKSNLCVAVDVTRQAELLRLVEAVGPSACVIKTHVDILEDFDPSLPSLLKSLAQKYNFLIFVSFPFDRLTVQEDRKFADIGSTVSHQFHHGIYRISEWADLVTVHVIPGKGVVEGLKGNAGLLLIAEMSSEGNLAHGSYTTSAMELTKEYEKEVVGVIALHGLSPSPSLLTFTPGVQLEEGKDTLGQRYLTPAKVLKEGSDIIIVGRGICGKPNPGEMAELYRKEAWAAYESLL